MFVNLPISPEQIFSCSNHFPADGFGLHDSERVEDVKAVLVEPSSRRPKLKSEFHNRPVAINNKSINCMTNKMINLILIN